MTTKPPSTPRVNELRAERLRLGLKRREIYATDAQWEELKPHVARITAKTAKRKP